jgi:hypothetical protein
VIIDLVLEPGITAGIGAGRRSSTIEATSGMIIRVQTSNMRL